MFNIYFLRGPFWKPPYGDWRPPLKILCIIIIIIIIIVIIIIIIIIIIILCLNEFRHMTSFAYQMRRFRFRYF